MKRICRNSFNILWLLLLLLPILLVFFSVFRTGDIDSALLFLNSDFFTGVIDIIGIRDFYVFLKTNLFNSSLGKWYDCIFNCLMYYTVVNLLCLFFNFINFLIELCKEWLNGVFKKF